MPSKKTKKKKGPPEGACPYCWTIHPQSDYVPPEIPDNPNLIIVGEAPGEEERKKGQPFIGRSGQVLRSILSRMPDVRPAIINSSQCYSRFKPTTATINRNRDSVLAPLLTSFPSIPIVALGGFAAQYLAGGKRGEASLAGEVREMYSRNVFFTYHPAYFLYEHDDRIRSEIQTTLETAMRPYEKPKYIKNILPKDIETIVVDVETTSNKLPWYGSKITAIGIMPLGKPPYILKPEEIDESYKRLLNSSVRLVIGHNLGFDLLHLSTMGINFAQADFHDTMIYHKNLFPNEWSYGLKDLSRRYLKQPAWQGWFHKQIADGVDLGGIDWEKLAEYNAYDVYATEQLFLRQTRKYSPFDLEMDYLRYIIQMIQNGMYVNVQKLNDLGRRTEEELSHVESKIRADYSLGADFNFRSPAQLLNWFGKLGLDLPDTQEATLNEHKAEHPVIKDLLESRRLNKLKGTSIDGLTEFIDEQHRIHSSYAVHGAETSRLSSSRPNLQNTPPDIRPVFTSQFDNGKLVYSDLSSLEYRLIAHAAREYKLLSAFQDNQDIHKNAYRDILGREPHDEVERKLGKTCNYAGVYGCGLNKFVTLTELPYERAEEAFLRVQNLYPSITRWKEEIIYSLRYTGRVTNLFGRYREFVGRISQDIEREAINWIIQSSGHDILKVYLMEAVDALDYLDPKPLLVAETHDSFTLDCQPTVAQEAYEVVKNVSSYLNEIIEESFGVRLRVPITSKVKLLEVWE